MVTIICPGFHHPTLTTDFLNAIYPNWRSREELGYLLIYPIQRYLAYDAFKITDFLQYSLADQPDQINIPLTFVAFSAGVVGAMGAAWWWQQQGGHVKALIALDGWGVPVLDSFPVYRLSHDYFTHWSSAVLGNGIESFWADPAVEHLELWRSPDTVKGWWLSSTSNRKQTTTAKQILIHWLTTLEEY
ncbi:MAG: hypothetical protein WBA13_17915 [Microcoleaceae cyanobacterium]